MLDRSRHTGAGLPGTPTSRMRLMFGGTILRHRRAFPPHVQDIFRVQWVVALIVVVSLLS